MKGLGLTQDRVLASLACRRLCLNYSTREKEMKMCTFDMSKALVPNT